jgi:hypothetical protein
MGDDLSIHEKLVLPQGLQVSRRGVESTGRIGFLKLIWEECAVFLLWPFRKLEAIAAAQS